MSKDVISLNVEDVIRSNYADYGKQVNFSRAIPAIDGLKPVHRRALIGTRRVATGKVTSTVNVVGSINVIHPFGTASIEQVVADLNRQGELMGEGQFGIKLLEDIPAAACFTGDTKIRLRDSRILPISKIVELVNAGEEIYVYSCDKDGGVHNGKVYAAQSSGIREIINVVLDNEEIIRCTPDHRFMLFDGSYKEAKDLSKEDSLMPFYTSRTNPEDGHSTGLFIKDNKSGRWIKHHYIDFDELKRCEDFDPNGVINVHHIDRNHYNDNPTNLLVMNDWSHLALHNREDVKGWHKLPLEVRSEITRESRKRMYLENPEKWKKYYSDMSNAQSRETRHQSRKLLHKKWCVKLFLMLLESGVSESEITEETWNNFVSSLNVNRAYKKRWKSVFPKYFKDLPELLEHSKDFNHRISRIEITGEVEEVFDISVEKYENFALQSGVFVHNCRYTRTGLSSIKEDYYFKLEKYAPLHEGEVEIEPEYLITPVPYSLIYGALNWGFGVAGRTPAFTYKSLLEAYEKDDPTLLIPNYGYNLNIDKSDLQGLWETGVGRLSLSYNLKRIRDDEFLIYGSGEGFKINLSAFNKFVQAGSVKIVNESTNEISIKISRAYRSRVDMEEVWSVCERVATQSRVYNILVIKDGVIQTIGIKNWLDITIGKYKEVYTQYKKDRVEKIQEEIQVLSFLPEVGKLLIEDKTDSEILKKVKGLTVDILDRIKRKTIASLRKKDTSKEISSLEGKIKDVEKENPDQVIKSYI